MTAFNSLRIRRKCAFYKHIVIPNIKYIHLQNAQKGKKILKF